MLQISTSTVLAQQQESVQPAQTAAPDTSTQAAASGPQRIEIRIEFPIVEPFFDIFYAREEPRIEADVITPIENPLKKLPQSPVEKDAKKDLWAKRLDKPQMLLERLRE